jgi:hypothetical protein
MAVAFAFTGWATAGASAAPPPAPQAQASGDGLVTVQDVWIRWRVYSTYAKCRQAGIDFTHPTEGIDAWRCSFDSPGWLLELRRAG